MPERERFECDRCGECCRHISGIQDLVAFDRGDGTCRHLVDNQCEIYERRPAICDVERMFETWFSKAMTWSEYILLTNESCAKLKKLRQERG